jgi:hypothetical protein
MTHRHRAVRGRDRRARRPRESSRSDPGLGDAELLAQPPVPPGGRLRRPGGRPVGLLREQERVGGQRGAEGDGDLLETDSLGGDERHGPAVDVDVAGPARLGARLLDPTALGPDVVPPEFDRVPGRVDVGEADCVQLAYAPTGDRRQPDEQGEGGLDVGGGHHQGPDVVDARGVRFPADDWRELDVGARVTVDPPPPLGGVECLGEHPVHVPEGHRVQELPVAPDTDLLPPLFDAATPPLPASRLGRRQRSGFADEVLGPDAEPVATDLPQLAVRPFALREEPRRPMGQLRTAVHLDPARSLGGRACPATPSTLPPGPRAPRTARLPA